MSQNLESVSIWAFDCPYHGTEVSLYCFRAFDENNRHRWHKYVGGLEKVAVSNAEIEEAISVILNKK